MRTAESKFGVIRICKPKTTSHDGSETENISILSTINDFPERSVQYF